MRGVPDRYRACLERLRIGLRLPSDPEAALDQPDVAAAYRAALVPFRAYLRGRPYLLEHALLNRVRLTNFPFDPRRTVYEEYALFVSYYGLLKLHLIGAAEAEGGLSDELVVETVQAFDKYADSKAYWQRMLANLKQEAALNAAGLAALALD